MTDKLTNSKLYLFLYTMKEYQRFSGELCSHELTADYDAESYVQINTKLILLRKYGSKGEPVFIEEILDEMKKTYPHKSEEASKILDEYHEIINMQIEQILADGTKLNLYQTIEDVMYGLYLHADANRIQRLVQTDEQLRFACIRKYVEDFEKVLFKIIKCLRECGMDVEEIHKEHASIIAFGNQSESQNVVNSPFWSNMYGHDADDEELKQIYGQLVLEDIEILIRCNIFLEELKKEVISVDLLDKLIFPSTKKDWKNYSEAREFFLGIKNPGISSKVRYNEQHTMAYVRIHPQVDNPFRLVGFGDNAGSGFPTILDVWKSEGWIKPELIEDTNLDQVTLVMKMEKESDDESAEKSADSKKIKAIDLSERQKQILAYMDAGVEYSTEQVAEKIGLKGPRTRQLLNELVNMELLACIGTTKKRRYIKV